jgi:hypothetical protein
MLDSEALQAICFILISVTDVSRLVRIVRT